MTDRCNITQPSRDDPSINAAVELVRIFTSLSAEDQQKLVELARDLANRAKTKVEGSKG